LIPAAGSGSRIGAARAKQYCDIAGKPMICHALETFAACRRVERIFVVISDGDHEFAKLPLSQAAMHRSEALVAGGPTRHASVENGLAALAPRLSGDDWVLVHDAARPGLSLGMIERLIDSVGDDPAGGLLALPLADTLKRASAEGASRSLSTVARDGLWQAQTPQMFRHGALLAALARARTDNRVVTDEASAMEQTGAKPLLVVGDVRNFKVTYPDDMLLADQLLRNTQ
jgi:2-C-methyl-D-erythritol 4-phosphate cytidylyltransferase